MAKFTNSYRSNGPDLIGAMLLLNDPERSAKQERALANAKVYKKCSRDVIATKRSQLRAKTAKATNKADAAEASHDLVVATAKSEANTNYLEARSAEMKAAAEYATVLAEIDIDINQYLS